MWNWGFRGCKQQLRPCKLNSVHSAKAIPPKGDEHPLGLAEGVERRTPRPFRRSSWSIFIVDGFCRTFGHDGAIQCCQVGLLKNLVAADSLGSSMIRAGGDRMLGRRERLGGCLGLGSILLQVRQLELELFEDRWPNRWCRSLAIVYLSLSISSARNLASLFAANRAARSLSRQAPARIRKRAIDRPI